MSCISLQHYSSKMCAFRSWSCSRCREATFTRKTWGHRAITDEIPNTVKYVWPNQCWLSHCKLRILIFRNVKSFPPTVKIDKNKNVNANYENYLFKVLFKWYDFSSILKALCLHFNNFQATIKKRNCPMSLLPTTDPEDWQPAPWLWPASPSAGAKRAAGKRARDHGYQHRRATRWRRTRAHRRAPRRTTKKSHKEAKKSFTNQADEDEKPLADAFSYLAFLYNVHTFARRVATSILQVLSHNMRHLENSVNRPQKKKHKSNDLAFINTLCYCVSGSCVNMVRWQIKRDWLLSSVTFCFSFFNRRTGDAPSDNWHYETA